MLLMTLVDGSSTHPPPAVGALDGIFSIFGLGSDTTEVNSLDVWNCVQGYVEQYVQQIVDQLRTQDINQRVR